MSFAVLPHFLYWLYCLLLIISLANFFTHIEIPPLLETAKVGLLKWNLGSQTGIILLEIGTVALTKKILKLSVHFCYYLPLEKDVSPPLYG